MPYNGGDCVLPDKSFLEVIWENLQKYGDNTAIIDASQTDKSITFMELYNLARKCGAYLQSMGIRKGDYISISASGSIEFTCIALGILASGAVVAPCNPSYRKNEVLQQFKITHPRAVFVDEAGVETMKTVKAEFPSLERIFVIGECTEYTTLNQIFTDADAGTLQKVEFDQVNDVAFAPHSSGTTGLPKCVMMTHQNYNAALQVGGFMATGASQSGYCDRPMYHTGGYGYVLTNVLSGVKMVTAREFQLEKFFKIIESYGVFSALCVPPMLIEMANATNIDRYDLSSLKLIVAGGAPMAPDVIQRILKKYKFVFAGVYGMTECGSISKAIITKGNTSPSSGKVQKGIEMKITNFLTEEECPNGTDGEIRIRGAQVTKGYLGNPEANATAFDQDGWFKTGDIGHFDDNGNLYIVDRLKQIIKYKSVQISPAELEAVILRHPKVLDVGVVGIPDEASGEVPKAFIVRRDPSLTADEVHEIVNENLVEYKHLRGGIEFVNSIPKSETGKIQRDVLKKMAGF